MRIYHRPVWCRTPTMYFSAEFSKLPCKLVGEDVGGGWSKALRAQNLRRYSFSGSHKCSISTWEYQTLVPAMVLTVISISILTYKEMRRTEVGSLAQRNGAKHDENRTSWLQSPSYKNYNSYTQNIQIAFLLRVPFLNMRRIKDNQASSDVC